VKSTPVRLINKLLLSGVLLGVCLALTGTSMAQNQYYVSPSGSDSGSGSSGSPWATISHASTALTLGAGGAVVNVASGTYNTCLSTDRSGTASQPIVYKSTTPLGAKIVCSGDPAWYQKGAYVTIQGFDATATSSGSCYAINIEAVHNNVIGNYAHDIICSNQQFGGAGIVLGSSTGNQATDSTVIGNIVDNIAFGSDSCSTVHGIYYASDRVVIQNNIVSRACAWGIQGYHHTTGDVISNNTVMNNKRGGILVTASEGTINDSTSVFNNIVINNGHSGGTTEYGIEERWGSTGPNNTYRNNLVVQNSPGPFNFSLGRRITSGNLCDTSGPGCASVISAAQANPSNIFVNYTGNAKTGDYHLKAGAVAIAAGVTGACASGGMSPCVPTTDIVGVIRPSAALAMGVFDQDSGAAGAVSAPTGLTASVQ
jgi:hypothetical protein